MNGLLTGVLQARPEACWLRPPSWGISLVSLTHPDARPLEWKWITLLPEDKQKRVCSLRGIFSNWYQEVIMSKMPTHHHCCSLAWPIWPCSCRQEEVTHQEVNLNSIQALQQDLHLHNKVLPTGSLHPVICSHYPETESSTPPEAPLEVYLFIKNCLQNFKQRRRGTENKLAQVRVTSSLLHWLAVCASWHVQMLKRRSTQTNSPTLTACLTEPSRQLQG